MNLLSERNPLEIRVDHGGLRPRWSDLPPTAGLLERLGDLGANGWLVVSARRVAGRRD